MSMDAENRRQWHVYSSDTVMINKLDKVSDAVEEDDWGKHYILDSNQVRFFRPISDEQRKKAAARFKSNLDSVS